MKTPHTSLYVKVVNYHLISFVFNELRKFVLGFANDGIVQKFPIATFPILVATSKVNTSMCLQVEFSKMGFVPRPINMVPC
jgi:hypothetical protein